MTRALPPEDLECPDPERCPVAVDVLSEVAQAGRLPVVETPGDRTWYRVYDARDGYATPNPGYGNTRFAPFDDTSGARVPTLYLAESLAAALLETSLHDLVASARRYVAEAALHGKHHARLLAPEPLRLADLRDPALASLDLSRSNVASSTEEHYACTRRVARAVHASPQHVAGILWHSRQAELNQQPAAEVAVIFGDRVAMDRDAWGLAYHRGASGALLEGAGRLLLDQLAEELDFTILLADM